MLPLGNLTEILDGLCCVVRERLEFYDKVKTLTAQSRVSANVLSALPFALGGLSYLLNPYYIEPLISTEIGRMVSAVAVVLVVIGFTVCRRMARIEI